MKNYKLTENRREYFDALYKLNLEYGIMPGLVYLYMPSLAKHYSWNNEDKLWFSFLNGMTQNPITSIQLLEQLPKVPPAGATLSKFNNWFNDNWDILKYDTDRRYQKKDTVDAIKSYAQILSNYSSQEKMLTNNYKELWNLVSNNYNSFGRLSSFSYLEYVYLNGFGADCDNLLFEDKSGSKSHRNGMMILHGADNFVWDKRARNEFTGEYPDFKKVCSWLDEVATQHLTEFKNKHPDILHVGNFTFESNLCTFKNHFFGRRYPGVYADMAWQRIEWAEERGIDTSIFKNIREEHLPDWLRIECSNLKVDINKFGSLFQEQGTPFRGDKFLCQI